MAVLELHDVSKRYGLGGPTVLEHIDLTVEAGQTLAVTGPSGTGKSTLLNIMGALDRPTGGQVVFDGVELGKRTDRELADLRNRQIGFVFQQHHLLAQCSAVENVLLPTLVTKDRAVRSAAGASAERLLDRVGLGDRMHHRPGELSGGQCQRVAFVRALINGPKLLLADEPTGSLDRAAAEGLGDLMIELNREEKVTLIVASHAKSLAARMGQVLELRDGRLAAAEVAP